MPLHTSIIRDGETLSVRWSGFHVAAMAIIAIVEDPRQDAHHAVAEDVEACVAKNDGKLPIDQGLIFTCMDYSVLATTALNDGRYEVKEPHTFVDVSDGEVFEILPGDVLLAGRM